MNRILIAASLLLVLAGACSGKGHRPQAQASPSAEASTPTALAENPRDVNIRWAPAQAPLFEGEEERNPASQMHPDIPPERLQWSLYAANLADAAPTLLYSGPRPLLAPAWALDGGRVSVRYASAASTPPNGPNILAGLLSFDTSPAYALAADVSVQAGGLLGGMPTWSPDGRMAIVTRPTSIPLPATVGAAGGYSPPTETTLIDVTTRAAWKLQGFTGNSSAVSDGWSPDGRFVLVAVFPSGARPMAMTPTSDYYVVPVTGGIARFIGSGTFLHAAWSSQVVDKLTYIDDAGALWLFDANSGRSARLSTDGSFNSGQSPEWLTSTKLKVRNRVVEINSGVITTYPANPPSDFYAISPDGRYLLTHDSPVDDSPGHCPSISPPDDHVFLFDKEAQQTTTLKDCDGRFFFMFDWLGDSRHAVMRQSPCAACDGFGQGLVLKDVETGAESALTAGFEETAWPTLSPDGHEVLVTGDRLRVYDEDGTLLRAIDVPESFSVAAAAWAPDGRRFVYVVAPKGVGYN